ncbi:DUF6268 family outer membrane beta-barrel protein [Cochleicola gelatinilyticus]|uniref:DUF6268 domain-containing protein n=1 Tax=Cochleicola gelatinilyticus TaxID=1763537 RepID=A0A167IXV2_9FLAO|nr:DUF6268 family outer membrane beta-barrel protein [Cochleicola gelatinilyticus]OAB80117.1 hypothetical protein ULVI_05095 [Cochleicola gelatinilyticus]
MKNYCILLVFVSCSAFCQNYVDLLKVGYGQTFNNDYVNTVGSTNVSSLDIDLTVPIVLSEKNAFITGVAFSTNHLELAPNTSATTLYSTILKLGLATTFNDTWSSTLVLLPKIASDYNAIKGDDFYFGGLGLLKYQKNEHLKYRFGLYATTEAFGFFTTPIIGWYYLSKNNKFEMDMSLPIAADVNYTFGKTTVGVDYYGIGRSFRLYDETDTSERYVDLSSLEFSSYIQLNLLEKTVLLRGKIGYSSNNYEVYSNAEKIDLGVSAFSFGDDRTQLNPDVSGGFFAKIEAIYRFNLPSTSSE